MSLSETAGVVILVLAVSSGGCDLRVRIGEHDGGAHGGCTTDGECVAGNQCVCGRCLTLDLPAPACDPGCSEALHGDFCTTEGRTCLVGACSALVCTMGSLRLETDRCDGGGVDAGRCECPPDVMCTADVCALDCSPQDATPYGRCSTSAGWAWDGMACRELACSCVGAECSDVFASESACDAHFGACRAP